MLMQLGSLMLMTWAFELGWFFCRVLQNLEGN